MCPEVHWTTLVAGWLGQHLHSSSSYCITSSEIRSLLEVAADLFLDSLFDITPNVHLVNNYADFLAARRGQQTHFDLHNRRRELFGVEWFDGNECA